MTSIDAGDLEQTGVNVIRGLAMDAVKRADSGHTGTAMALAPLAHVLFTRVMTYDATHPHWPDRDRFVLSNGHASMLQYAMLYLTGVGLELDDIRAFRQFESATPGHPEAGHTTGVEVTTGPLGQGFGNAVGMALAERWLRATHGPEISDHHIFCTVSDGDLMEGVSHEAASLAGHQRLGRLVVVYDDNRITIDGPTDLAFSDDTPARFRAYGWHVLEVGEVANDLDVLEKSLREAMAADDRPSMIVLRSHIGWPLPTKTDTADAHGAITDTDELNAAKERLGLPVEETFWVPDDVLEMYRTSGRRGARARQAWESRLADWSGDRARLDAELAGGGVEGWRDALPSFDVGDQIATRKASGAVLDALLPVVPGLVAGGGDLTGNTGTDIDAPVMSAEQPDGRKLHFGIREHAMAAAMNGMAKHGGVLPVGGTFLVFSDYCRPSIRLAALSGAKVVYSFTHDSIGVGEDGPTHQPVEHVSALRAIPDLRVIRPADANECAHAWGVAVDHDGPTAMILTRQGVPVLEGTGPGVERGGYVISGPDDADLVIIGTGSELQLAVGAAERLRAQHAVRVVSLPSFDLFLDQDDAYRAQVLPPGVPTLAVEAGTSHGWHRFADATVTLDHFGASAPGDVVMRELGFTVEAVVEAAHELLARS